ncbi:MAG: Asp-tRNA(Asn)/Glu-tRNA(Gln) amidotransferase subunit GatA [Symbiobacteriia bacterium]
MTLYENSAAELARLLRDKQVSAVELTRAVLDRIERVDDQVKAFVTATPELALAQAEAVDRRRATGETLPFLAGIPIALKDNMNTVGVRTTCSSRILENYIPPYDATVVDRLNAAGTVTVGKTNLDEFAMGSSTENSAFGATHNPWDLSRVPGGSSGGSAAAVAAGEAVLALGSDTGGSIRQPAALCGVVGLKPTYGRVSRYGLVAFASSLDQIGPFGRTVEDVAWTLGAISGHDRLDATSAPIDVPDFTANLNKGVRGLRLGIPKEYFATGITPEVRDAVMKAIDVLVAQGAVVEEVSLPHTEYALSAYYVIAPAEASSNLARYDGVRYGVRAKEYGDLTDMFSRTRGEGFGPEVKRRIMLGTYALSSGYYDAYYVKAQKVRTLVNRDFDAAFQRVDALVTPTAPSVAFPIGAKAEDPLAMYLQDICTIPVNLAGLPGLSLPCGFATAANGVQLPIGLQVIGKLWDEGTVLQVGHAYQQATDYHRRIPQLGAAGPAAAAQLAGPATAVKGGGRQ